MKNRPFWLQFRSSWLLAAITAMITTPVAAQTANFGTMKLSPGFTPEQGTAAGYTGGSYSLSAMSNRDKNKKVCLGFGDPNPDHILVLEEDFEKLTISINSGNTDTTIFIKGPDDKTIRCGDDTGISKDASVSSNKWKSGIYQIWVGIFNQGVKANYTLKVEEK
ncbi:hypothetical protein [Sphaerospermopsis torques-reginae]|uniref:Peptidase domain-containing protein n=1 Tax=Sphaerospermopsis torques-reginae ITEP-024 TaxID=984208 RepID=A0ABX8WV83_9CYAN|nr:hypothetical protein [Sphaerospermopsis torques-reginae]QYX30321.1 hypothetical protein K2F26_15455 [Sphaerospermopsis torques-reginae ITEP-024]